MNNISPIEFEQLRKNNENLILIDVRMASEFHEKHVPGAQNIPFDALDFNAVTNLRGKNATQPVYLMCTAGVRSLKAVEKLERAGLDNLVNLAGGMRAWLAQGLPVSNAEVGPQSRISLERQVRITAGVLVLLGIFFSFFLHPGFLIISGFVGAGLVYSGATDTCGMAACLTKMPWNK